MLTAADQGRLLRLARRALEARVRRDAAPPLERGDVADPLSGAFVSVHCRGELRGCLGHLEPEAPLSEMVASLAEAVSDSDPRFDPVRLEELIDLEIEISVLGPDREVTSPDEVDVGRHGLIVEMNGKRGLLLPQVPVERGWDRHAFLEHACLKAGLARDAWRCGARMFVFEAVVFKEQG